MAISLISSDISLTGVAITLGDTSGGNLIVAGYGENQDSSPTMSDSFSNTFSLLTKQSAPGATYPSFARLGYVTAPTVGASHEVNTTTQSGYAHGAAAFSGVDGGFVQASSAGGTGTTVQPGSITPPENGCLFVTIWSGAGVDIDPAIDSSFTMLHIDTTNDAFAIAYKISSAAENPTWTHNDGFGSLFGQATAMACFRPTVPPATDTGNFFQFIF